MHTRELVKRNHWSNFPRIAWMEFTPEQILDGIHWRNGSDFLGRIFVQQSMAWEIRRELIRDQFAIIPIAPVLSRDEGAQPVPVVSEPRDAINFTGPAGPRAYAFTLNAVEQALNMSQGPKILCG